MHYLERQSVPQVYPTARLPSFHWTLPKGFCQTVNAPLAEKHSNRTAWTLENVPARSPMIPILFSIGGSSSSESHISRLLLTEMGQGVLLDCSVAIRSDGLSH